MPSLLERVGRSLTRKKPEISTSNRDSAGTALEGFEAVSPSDVKGYVAPAVTSPSQEKSQGALKSFLRAKSPSRNAAAQPAKAPLLSLHLPELSQNRDGGSKEKLGITFEEHPDPAYTDEVLSTKRLNTAETLLLVQKTSSVLLQKGLETPGIFKTFWHRQNADSQRKLIIAFLQTLSTGESVKKVADDGAQETTDVSNPATDTFNTRLNNTSPYDLAEVFKWALRHFKHDGASFGTSSDEYGWYKAFADAEKTASYPPDAYSTILAPLIPAAHLELLNSIFHLATSVAALGETNGVSGSKLSRSVGWWLLSERSRPTSGLVGFLQDWDTAARILEHLFLAYVRDQQRLGLMPKRLTQLVKAYPYPKQANPTTDQYYLPRPKFSTQQRTVLFVRAAVPASAINFYHGRPLQLLKDAIVAPPEDPSANADYRAIWESLKREATTDRENVSNPTSPVDLNAGAPVVSVTTLLSEGAVHLFTTTTGESAVTSPIKPSGDLASSWVRSFSPARREAGGESTNTTAPVSPMEWDDFTGAGFAAGLNDSTTLSFSDFAPPPPKQGSATVSGGTRNTRINRGKRSTEFKRPRTPAVANGSGAPKGETLPTKDASTILSDSAEPPLEIDETLIEGWAEILTDKVISSGTWPTFAIYELRNPLVVPISTGVGAGDEPNRIRWLAIETYVHSPPPTEPSPPSSPVKGGKVKRSSSVKSDKRPRFGFFSSTTSLTGKDKDLKEEKKEKRKDHARRASEISTESATGKMVKEPGRSQVDLAAPPAIAEEPEPATPLKGISEEKATVLDTAAVDATAPITETEKEAVAEAFPSKHEELATLVVPQIDGSRFVEGSTPGTLPESMTEPLETGAPRTDDKEVSAITPIVAVDATAGGAALLKQGSSDEPEVPVSQYQPPIISTTADGAVAPHYNGGQGVHESQPPAPTDEVIQEPDTALENDYPEPEVQDDTTISAKVQEDEAARAEIEAQQARDAEVAESRRVAQEKMDQERLALEEAAKVEAELEAKRAAEAEEKARAVRLEAEQEAQRLAQEKMDQERLALEAQRIAAAAEAERLVQQKLEQERLALEAQRIAQAAESERLAQEKLEQERLALEEAAKVEAELEAKRTAEAEEKARAIRLEAEQEAQRLAQEKMDQERLALEEAAKVEAELEAKRAAEAEEKARAIRLEAEQEAQRLAQEKMDQERLALEAQRIAAAAEAERLVQQKLEQERLALEAQRIAQAAESERLAQEKLEQERLALEEAAKVEAELEAKRTAEAEEKARAIRLEAEQEAQRLAQEKMDQERLALEEAAKVEAELEAKRAAEAEEKARAIRLEAEQEALRIRQEEQLRAEQEALEIKQREEQAQAEAERVRLAQLERERLEREELARIEQERLEREALEIRQREEQAQAEAERVRLAQLEQDRLESEELARIEFEKQRIKEEEENAARIRAQEMQAEKLQQAQEAEELEARRAKEEEENAARATIESTATPNNASDVDVEPIEAVEPVTEKIGGDHANDADVGVISELNPGVPVDPPVTSDTYTGGSAAESTPVSIHDVQGDVVASVDDLGPPAVPTPTEGAPPSVDTAIENVTAQIDGNTAAIPEPMADVTVDEPSSEPMTGTTGDIPAESSDAGPVVSPAVNNEEDTGEVKPKEGDA